LAEVKYHVRCDNHWRRPGRPDGGIVFPGGQLAQATLLENVPGFHEGISGPDYAMQLEQQASRFGLDIRYEAVTGLELSGDPKKVVTSTGETLETKTVIVCSGLSQSKLMVEGEDRLLGRGVSTCATCDGALYKGMVTMVAGAGNTAVNDVLYLAPLCEKVYLVHRGEKLEARQELLDALQGLTNVELLPDSVVTALNGQDQLESVQVKSMKDGREPPSLPMRACAPACPAFSPRGMSAKSRSGRWSRPRLTALSP